MTDVHMQKHTHTQINKRFTFQIKHSDQQLAEERERRELMTGNILAV